MFTMTGPKKCLMETYDDDNNLLITTTLRNDFSLDEAFIEAQDTIEQDYMKKIGA